MSWSECSTLVTAGLPLIPALTHLLPDMQLTVYSAPWCPDCREAKRFLDRYKIPYTDINIETTPGAADEVVRRTGKRAIPQFVVDGEWVQPYRPGEGFLYDAMAKRLGVEGLSD
ncbi:MAG: glutaredoxin family protein [Terriglobales bacterium]